MPSNPNPQSSAAVPALLPLLAVATLLIAYWMTTINMGETVSSLIKPKSASTSRDASPHDVDKWHYEYTTMKGFFLQDSSATHPGTFDAMNENFGLIEQEYVTDKQLPANGKDLTQWQRFAHMLKVMNQKATKNVSYRLLYLGRHGQGYHNVAAKYYGDEAWDCYYSTLHDDPHVPDFTVFDAHLTLLGKHQAYLVSQFWNRLISEQKIPVPQKYYCSPHTRAIQTAKITFSSLPLPSTSPFDPLIKELIREGHGVHTCDQRSTRSYIKQDFPEFRIENGFTENDEIYSPILREPPLHHSARMASLLDDVFSHDDSTYISMTSHSGTIQAMLHAIGHRPFVLPTGGVIPVLIRATKVSGPRPDNGSANEDWETQPKCVNDPLKAGLPEYRNIGEYLAEIDASVPRGDDGGYGHLEIKSGKVKEKDRERIVRSEL